LKNSFVNRNKKGEVRARLREILFAELFFDRLKSVQMVKEVASKTSDAARPFSAICKRPTCDRRRQPATGKIKV
jgi:hypothetical protein